MEIELDVVMTAPGDKAGYRNDRARRYFVHCPILGCLHLVSSQF